MQQPHFLVRTLLALALITLLAVAVYEVLPEKRRHWLPGPDSVAHIYSDTMEGGSSQAEWIDQDDLHFRCEIKPRKPNTPPFCGFHLHLGSTSQPTVDLTSYNRLHVDLDYSGGNQKLRFYIQEFVTGFTDPDQPVHSQTAKYESAYVPAEETRGEVVIHMDEFIVADWWVNNNNVPRHYTTPSRESVLLFGVDIAFPTALGQHELQLNRLTFVGDWVSAESWYLGILVAWMLALVIAAMYRAYYLRKLFQTEHNERAMYQRLSMIDSLTGLFNRQGLLTYYKNEVANGKEGWPVSILVIDIDHFKPVNDTFGHSAGDAILRRIAISIGNYSRQRDKVARWGGEEFLVILPNTPASQAHWLAERLRKAVMNLIHPEIENQMVSISIGISEMYAGDDIDSAFNRADAALYQAKNSGRNRVVRDDQPPNRSERN